MPPPTAKKLPKIGKKREKIWKIGKKEEKSERKGKYREGSFTLPLLTDRASYATILIAIKLTILEDFKTTNQKIEINQA